MKTDYRNFPAILGRQFFLQKQKRAWCTVSRYDKIMVYSLHFLRRSTDAYSLYCYWSRSYGELPYTRRTKHLITVIREYEMALIASRLFKNKVIFNVTPIANWKTKLLNTEHKQLCTLQERFTIIHTSASEIFFTQESLTAEQRGERRWRILFFSRSGSTKKINGAFYWRLRTNRSEWKQITGIFRRFRGGSFSSKSKKRTWCTVSRFLCCARAKTKYWRSIWLYFWCILCATEVKTLVTIEVPVMFTMTRSRLAGHRKLELVPSVTFFRRRSLRRFCQIGMSRTYLKWHLGENCLRLQMNLSTFYHIPVQYFPKNTSFKSIWLTITD